MYDSPLLKLLDGRYATRAILPDPLPQDTVNALIEAIRLTPSCANKQPWRYLFVQSEEGLAKAREALTGGNRGWAITAPLLVIGYAKAQNDCQPGDGREYYHFDTGMSTMNLMLEATAHDLVARPMAGWKPEMIRKDFGLEDDDEPIVMVAIGKRNPDDSYVPDSYKGLDDKPRTRKAADEIIRHA
ncbi:nitroreductase family protein [bacterium]|nr:nitroreductase family protein [bacterium]